MYNIKLCTICDKEAEDLVYNSSKWPSGTYIRP